MHAQPSDGPTAEQQWLASYDPRAYPPVAVTVDVVALTLRESRLHVLLVERAAPPFRGCWALPGGFLQAGQEDLDTAAAREFAEETGLHTGFDRGTGSADAADGRQDRTDSVPTPGSTLGRVHLEQLGTYGAPGRDPRMHVVSVAYLALAPDLPDPRAGSDAAAAAWCPVDSLRDVVIDAGPEDRSAGAHGGGPGGPTDGSGSGPDGPADGLSGWLSATPAVGPAPVALAFDHARILADALDRARSKIEYSPLATAFLGPEFTIPELRAVYEAIWQEKLHPGNFHRKVLSVPGFIESTGSTAERGSARGGPRAKCYRAGDARLLHPALLRPTREEAIR